MTPTRIVSYDTGPPFMPITKAGRGNAGATQSLENDTTVSHPSHSSLEDADSVSHIPTATTTAVLSFRVRKKKPQEWAMEKMEDGVSHFPPPRRNPMTFDTPASLLPVFQPFAIYAGAVICFGSAIFGGIRLRNDGFYDAVPALFGLVLGTLICGWGLGRMSFVHLAIAAGTALALSLAATVTPYAFEKLKATPIHAPKEDQL